MLHAKLQGTLVLQHIVFALHSVLDKITIKCDENGMLIHIMDDEHVILVSLHLPANEFSAYSCDGVITLEMELKALGAVLSCCDNDDNVTIFADNVPTVLHFMFENTTCKERVSKFSINLIDNYQEFHSFELMNYSGAISMSSKEFERAVKELSQFGNSLEISCNSTSLKLQAKDDLSRITASETILFESDFITRVDILESTSATYNTNNMLLFLNGTVMADQVKLYLSNDWPIVAEFKIANNGILRYCMAHVANPAEPDSN